MHPDHSDPWSVRQTAVYHRLEKATGQAIWIFMHPKAKSVAHKQILDHITSQKDRESNEQDPMFIHSLLWASYVGNWRDYMEHYEGDILKIVSGFLPGSEHSCRVPTHYNHRVQPPSLLTWAENCTSAMRH